MVKHLFAPVQWMHKASATRVCTQRQALAPRRVRHQALTGACACSLHHGGSVIGCLQVPAQITRQPPCGPCCPSLLPTAGPELGHCQPFMPPRPCAAQRCAGDESQQSRQRSGGASGGACVIADCACVSAL